MAASMTFKIRCIVAGHSKDVRSLHSLYVPEGAFVSGSRDVSARVWAPLDGANCYEEAQRMTCHTNFVSCVLVAPPSEKYPQGVILTGSNDSNIFGYTLASCEPIFKLTEHTNTVCSLAAGKFGTILSGSWDLTARVWLNEKCAMVLKGHEAAVWAVAVMPEHGVMLTGSADKTIKMWKAGKCEQTLKGHTDCVRGLAVLSNSEFLSCSNDATIRRWNINGTCAHVYYGHENYIYSIAVMPNGTDFVTTSEDRSLRVWSNGECQQTIAHPTQSIWSVCVLANGDIVTGASDGIIRIFTNDPFRQATPLDQEAFVEEVAQSIIPTQVGDLKMEDLPGPEVLLAPGSRDGQTKLVKVGSRVQCHQWSAVEQKWTMVGDVVGSSGASQSTSGKTLFDGEEYDYVFSVDIEEGKPPLKLPFNTNEDPWFAAQRFIDKHQLSQAFLDQVANFIQENTKGVTLSTGSGSSDPFTGAGRYVPGSGSISQAPMSDPFTGSVRYLPGQGDSRATSLPNSQSQDSDPLTGGSRYQINQSQPNPENSFFPRNSFHIFDVGKQEAILAKLSELNESISEELRLTNINGMKGLMNGDKSSTDMIECLLKGLEWPLESCFPVLDVTRLSIRFNPINEYLCKDAPGFFPRIISYLTPEAPIATQMLALRTVCNAFNQSEGVKKLIEIRENMINSMLLLQESTNKNVLIALSSVLMNYSVALVRNADVEARSQCALASTTLLENVKDSEALFRLLVSIGTLATSHSDTRELCKSLNLNALLEEYCKRKDLDSKVIKCARCLIQTLAQ